MYLSLLCSFRVSIYKGSLYFRSNYQITFSSGSPIFSCDIELCISFCIILIPKQCMYLIENTFVCQKKNRKSRIYRISNRQVYSFNASTYSLENNMSKVIYNYIQIRIQNFIFMFRAKIVDGPFYKNSLAGSKRSSRMFDRQNCLIHRSSQLCVPGKWSIIKKVHFC